MLLFKKIFLTSSLLITPVLIIPFIIQQVTNSNNHKSDVSENTQAYNFTLGQQFSVDGDNLFAQKWVNKNYGRQNHYISFTVTNLSPLEVDMCMYYIDCDVTASNRNVILTPQPTIKVSWEVGSFTFNVTSLSNTCLDKQGWFWGEYKDVNCLVFHKQASYFNENRVYVELDLKNATNLHSLGTARKRTAYSWYNYSSSQEGFVRFFEQGMGKGGSAGALFEYTAITSIKNILCAPISNVSGGIDAYPSSDAGNDKKSYPANFKNKYTFSGEEFKLPSYNIDVKWLYDYTDPNYIEGKSPTTNKNHDWFKFTNCVFRLSDGYKINFSDNVNWYNTCFTNCAFIINASSTWKSNNQMSGIPLNNNTLKITSIRFYVQYQVLSPGTFLDKFKGWYPNATVGMFSDHDITDAKVTFTHKETINITYDSTKPYGTIDLSQIATLSITHKYFNTGRTYFDTVNNFKISNNSFNSSELYLDGWIMYIPGYLNGYYGTQSLSFDATVVSDLQNKTYNFHIEALVNIETLDIPTSYFFINFNRVIISMTANLLTKNYTNFLIPASCSGMETLSQTSIASTFGNRIAKIYDDTTGGIVSTYYVGKNFFKDAKLADVNELSLLRCTEINDGAFQNVNVNNIKPLINVTKIGNNAFNSNLAKFTNISSPLCINVGNNAFANNPYLTSASLPNAQSIGDSAFANTPLSKIEIGAKSDRTPISYNNCLKDSGILSSSINNKKIIVPANNLATNKNSPDWAKSYLNPIYGWVGTNAPRLFDGSSLGMIMEAA